MRIKFTCDRCGKQSERYHTAKKCYCGGSLVSADTVIREERIDRIDQMGRDLADVCRAASRLLCCEPWAQPVCRGDLVEILDRIASSAESLEDADADAS